MARLFVAAGGKSLGCRLKAVMPRPGNVSKGFAFLSFENVEAAKSAVLEVAVRMLTLVAA